MVSSAFSFHAFESGTAEGHHAKRPLAAPKAALKDVTAIGGEHTGPRDVTAALRSGTERCLERRVAISADRKLSCEDQNWSSVLENRDLPNHPPTS